MTTGTQRKQQITDEIIDELAMRAKTMFYMALDGGRKWSKKDEPFFWKVFFTGSRWGLIEFSNMMRRKFHAPKGEQLPLNHNH